MTWLSLYVYVSCHGYRIEGSYLIEWCIGEPMPVFVYRILQYHKHHTNILYTNIHLYYQQIRRQWGERERKRASGFYHSQGAEDGRVSECGQAESERHTGMFTRLFVYSSYT